MLLVLRLDVKVCEDSENDVIPREKYTWCNGLFLK